MEIIWTTIHLLAPPIVGVVVVGNHDVFESPAGCDGESAGLIGVILSWKIGCLETNTECARGIFTRRFMWFLGIWWLLSFVGFPNVPFCCCFVFLNEFLDKLFGDYWPCGEEMLFLIADISMDVHGLHSARWRKVHRSAFDLDSYRLPEKWRSGIFTSVIFSFCSGFRGTM